MSSGHANSSQDGFMASQPDIVGESFRAQLTANDNINTEQVLIQDSREDLVDICDTKTSQHELQQEMMRDSVNDDKTEEPQILRSEIEEIVIPSQKTANLNVKSTG